MGHEGVKAFGALNRQYVIKVLLLLPFPFRQKKKEAREKEEKYIETSTEIQ